MTKRLLELEPTSLFGDESILTFLSGREELSRPFDFMLTIASTNDKLKPEQVIGQPLAIRINRGENEPRYIHGYISSFWAGNKVSDKSGLKIFRMYRVRIVPWLWFMARASRCFVYLPEKAEKSIQEVLGEVIKRVKSYGHVDPKIESGNAKILSKRKVEHCVQYRETDLSFLSRTLERYGIFYYFKFANNQHTVVLSDQLNYPNAVESEVKYPHDADTHSGEDEITSWDHAYEFVSGKWEHTDYDFTHPSTDLRTSSLKHSSISLKNNSGYEHYEFPGDYMKKDDGEMEAAVRLESEESRFNTVVGTSTCKTFSPGYCFKLTEHLNCKDEKGKAYLITSVSHTASQPGPHTSGSQEATYSNSFSCISKESQYRPARATPHPWLSGVQTAVVVGPPGEEIHTDEYGRVKVKFYWDREPDAGENHSCWMRVSQVHAGKGFGGIDIPRVGEEVIVSFIEGDLDRPIITGRIYHKESMPPFALPGGKTRSGLKSKTYKGGGYNEMSMDDTPGKEQIRVHGQYDMDTVIEHDETLKIGNNRTKDIGVDEVMAIGNNQKLKVGVNKTVDIGTDHTETVGANQNIKIGSNQSTKIGANQSTTVAANQSNSVGTAKTETVGMISNEMVGFMKTTNVGAAYSIISAAAMNTAVGFVSMEEVGMTKKIIVGTKLEIIVGASKLVMEAGGKVTIEGTEFLFSASGNVKINGSIIDLN
ncbi:MAG: type VI secretion system tip protein TssI/VgrG [Pirellulaceae bacterium]|nr:type VI secretion system tip protein TssI/VgrG [Pirellulaceae bacterium]